MKNPCLSIAILLLPWMAGSARATEILTAINLTAEVASSSTQHAAGPAQRGIDGNLGNFTHTLGGDANPWWRVDFGVDRTFTKIVVHNRDDCCAERLSDITVQGLDGTDAEVYNSGELNNGNVLGGPAFIEIETGTPVTARAIKVSRDPLSTIGAQGVLSIGELLIGNLEDVFLPPNTNLTHVGILNMTTTQSSNWNGYSTNGAEAVDGNPGRETHTSDADTAATWSVDFGEVMSLQRVEILNRAGCCGDRLRDITLRVLDDLGTEVFNSGLLNPGNVLGFANAGGQPGLTVDLRALNGGKVIQGQVVEISRTPDPVDLTVPGFALSLGEVNVIGSSDVGPDSEPDGMPDHWETHFGLLVGTDDSAVDLESDGLTNVQEYELATDPTRADSDGDGLEDGAELAGDAVHGYTSDPLRTDTDGDGLTDFNEVNGDPTHNFISDPKKTDTDGDLFTDGVEVAEGTDPNDAGNKPNRTRITWIPALLGGDLTDPEDDGVEGAGMGMNFNWQSITSSSRSFFSGFGGNQGAFDVFDNSKDGNTGKWCCEGAPQNVTVQFLAPHALTHFTMTSSNDTPARDPINWAIQGSNDGVTWTAIYPAPGTTDVSSNFWGARRNQTIRFDLPAAAPFYTYFRYQVNTTGGANHALTEIEYFGEIDTTDSDSDGIPDWYENFYTFLNPNDATDAALDEDGEGLTNLEEFIFGSLPDKPDTEDDGLEDDEEQAAGTNPRMADTDQDLFTDKQELDMGSDPTEASSMPALNPIAWAAPANITGLVTDIDTTGTLVAAYAADTIPVTVGGIEFVVGGPSLGNEAFGLDPWDRLGDTYYETLMDGATYTAGAQLITLTGLTPGEHYQVQIWVADTRQCCPGRLRTFTTAPSTLDAAQTADVHSGTYLDEVNFPGQHVIGTFTAASDTQIIYATGVGVGAQYNALMVRQTGGLPDGPLFITDFTYDGVTASLTVTGFNTSKLYQLRRSVDLQEFGDVGAPFTPAAETGVVQDTAPTGPKAFYRIEETSP